MPIAAVQSRRARWVWVAALLALLSAVFVTGVVAGCVLFENPKLSRNDLLIATIEGDVVIRASERFLEANGRPPGSVAELVPAYLPAIPVPPAGFGPWRLHPKDPGGKDIRKFAVSAPVLGARRQWNTGYERIVCYVAPGRDQDWYASRPSSLVWMFVGGDSDSAHLRQAGKPLGGP
ncbi:MAG: hypothetical protein ACK54T_07535 [bacterium]